MFSPRTHTHTHTHSTHVTERDLYENTAATTTRARSRIHTRSRPCVRVYATRLKIKVRGCTYACLIKYAREGKTIPGKIGRERAGAFRQSFSAYKRLSPSLIQNTQLYARERVRAYDVYSSTLYFNFFLRFFVFLSIHFLPG